MFSGCGRPCARIVDSRATTGLPNEMASLTSGRTRNNRDDDGLQLLALLLILLAAIVVAFFVVHVAVNVDMDVDVNVNVDVDVDEMGARRLRLPPRDTSSSRLIIEHLP